MTLEQHREHRRVRRTHGLLQQYRPTSRIQGTVDPAPLPGGIPGGITTLQRHSAEQRKAIGEQSVD